MKYFSYLILFFITFSACEKKQTQIEKDDGIIKNYLSDNNLEAEYHYYGIYYNIVEEGSGGHPNLASTITVKYKGYLTNNKVFDEKTGDETLTLPLSDFILGWQVGVPLIQKGGKIILYIPSHLGYGENSVGIIPANSVLIFEIELIDFIDE